jgi:protein gp37
MGATGIEWTRGPNGEQGYTFNPWIGCTRVSPACDHCYAAGAAIKLGVEWDAQPRSVSESSWQAPLALNRKAAREGVRFRVFTGSMCDVLDKNASTPDRHRLWSTIEATPNLDWMILTKRPQLAGRYMPKPWWRGEWPRNAWFGFTAENQKEFDRRWSWAREVPAPLIFVSAEPLLEAYTLPDDAAKIGLFIVGGESGRLADCRPTPDGAFDFMRFQCIRLGIPFFMKQLDQINHRGFYKKFDRFPMRLQVREQPRILV